jgi:tetratricopeptide (TPR) repeat protein
LAEVERLVERLPQARFTGRYIEYLRDIVHFSVPVNDMKTVRMVEQRVEELLADENATPEFERLARTSIYRNLLPVFETEEELQRRMAHLAEFEKEGGRLDRHTQMKKLLLLEKIGRLDEALRLGNQVIPQFQERGLALSVITIRFVAMAAHAAFGESARQIVAVATGIEEGLSRENRELLRTHFGITLGTIALLRGEEKVIEDEIRRFITTEDREEGDDRGIIQLALGDREGIDRWFAEEGEGDRAAGIAAIVRAPLLTLKSVVRRLAAIEAMEEGVEESTAEDRRDRLLEVLEWFAERSLFAYMTPVIDRLAPYLARTEISTWRARAAEMERARNGAPEHSLPDRKPRLSMLGRIELVRPDDSAPARPRGARLRTLLGVMVATEMLDRPLSNREFYTLAAGEEDIDRARNTAYAAMHRLRESLGHDIVLSDGETPHLNLDLVDVDLLEAQAQLDEARQAAHDGALMRATRALMTALDITNGEVAFPTLYDPFFAAARADFEQDIATATLLVARLLLREGDRDTATQIITRALAMLPENAELKEMKEKLEE